MTTEELRKEIHARIDKLPEIYLREVFEYVKELSERARRKELVAEIIKEDYEVFKRLAE